MPAADDRREPVTGHGGAPRSLRPARHGERCAWTEGGERFNGVPHASKNGVPRDQAVTRIAASNLGPRPRT